MCFQPILLDNPTCRRLWKIKSALYVNGNISHYNSLNSIYEVSGYTKKGVKNTDPEEIDNIVNNNYIIVHGYRINCFISAPCGRCDSCKEKRRREYESRALFEAADFPQIYFFTLTYSNTYLPACGLCRRHVQASMKIFRERLARWYSKTYSVELEEARLATSFRVLYVGEYGTDPRYSQRPHYHGLFFFKNYIPDSALPFIYNILKQSWKYGKRIDFQKCRQPDASARYICKYITKQDYQDVPQGKNPCFIQGPSKNGGLGASNLQRYLYDIIHSPNKQIELRVGSKLVKVTIPSFLLKKIFPSFSDKIKGITDVFTNLYEVRDEMIARIEQDPFTHVHDPRIIDDVLQDYSFLLVSKKRYSQEYLREQFDTEVEPTPKREVKVYSMLTDEALNKFYFDTMFSLVQCLPRNEEEFFDEYCGKVRWLHNLKLPDLSFDERCKLETKKIYKNKNYVEKVMLSNFFDISLHMN